MSLSRYRFPILILAVLYIAYHLVTLPISPLPWFDETYYACITKNFIGTGKYHGTILPLFNNGKEIFWYGPLYFWTTSVPVRLFEMNIFSFRITGLLFGLADIYLAYLLFRRYIGDIKIIFGGILLLAIDPLFHSDIHSGRMDSQGLFFVLLSWYLFFIARSDAKPKYNPDILFFLSGIAAGAAVLTTLRVYFLFIPLGTVLLISAFRERSFKPVLNGLTWVVPVVAMYAAWFFFSYGNYESFSQDYAYIASLLKVQFRIRPIQYPLIIFTSLALGYGFFKNKSSYFFHDFYLVSLLSVILFYILIEDTGTYSFFILPCYYFLLTFSFLPIARLTYKDFRSVILFLMLFWNLGILAVKSMELTLNFSQRSASQINRFISDHIPSGSRVIGDEMYFYSVNKVGSDFQYIHLSNYLPKKEVSLEEYQREQYDYDYIVWSERLQGIQPGLLKLYAGKSQLEEIAALNIPQNNFYSVSGIMNVNVIASYNCRLYKRIRNNHSPQ